jgi:two-component system sensor histidine kinase/response regulator
MNPTRFNVLLVEDNPGDARLVRESLERSNTEPFDLEIADRLATALRRLSAGGIDAILLDLSLPDSAGQETFDRAKAQAPAVPIIVLTGLGDEAMALKMVREGAQDYVAKVDLNGTLLSRAIRYAIERERADQQVRKFNEELEERVRERTAELEAVNHELESFSYSVSHDLRTPLRHIDAYSTLLFDEYATQLGPGGQEYLGRVRGAAKHMADMIEGLLKLARCGRQPLELQSISLDQLVEDVVEDLRSEAAGRHVDWKIGALPSMECDRGLMERVFANLLGNSLKYTRGRPTALIEVGASIQDGHSVIFVRDNGAGFDMKYASKLFDAFQRLHSQKEFEGTGIGLATVQRIIQRHGGRIWAEAEQQKGATFFFSLARDAGGRAEK